MKTHRAEKNAHLRQVPGRRRKAACAFLIGDIIRRSTPSNALKNRTRRVSEGFPRAGAVLTRRPNWKNVPPIKTTGPMTIRPRFDEMFVCRGGRVPHGGEPIDSGSAKSRLPCCQCPPRSIGSRSSVTFIRDGSLILYIQHFQVAWSSK